MDPRLMDPRLMNPRAKVFVGRASARRGASFRANKRRAVPGDTASHKARPTKTLKKIMSELN